MQIKDSGPKRSFWCFISYRHADNQQPGRQWASWLHHALETYEVPADLVGRPNLRGEIIPERIYPVFRDEEELPADADLSRPIISALIHSRCLLVVCSPRACESRFVADEIARFKAMGKSERVIAAIIAGEPNASTDPAKIRQNLLECFPEPLRYEVEEDLSISDRQAEPVAADFRIEETGEEGWVNPRAYRAHMQDQGLPPGLIAERLKVHARRMELMKLKIIAGVIQVDLGELTKRDQGYQLELARKRARVLRRWLLAVAALTLLAVVSCILAVRNERRVKLLNQAQEKNLQEASWSSFHQADRLLADADASQDSTIICRKSQEAMLHLARSIKFNGRNRVARERFAWELGLRRACLIQPAAVLPLKSPAGLAVFSHDGGSILTSEADDTVSIWDADTRQLNANCQPGKQLFQSLGREAIDELSPYAAFSPDSTRFLTASVEKRVELWDSASGKKLHSLAHPDFVESASHNTTGEWILTTCGDGRARIWNARTAKMFRSLACEAMNQNTIFSADGREVINATGDIVSIEDIQTATTVRKIRHDAPVTAIACDAKGAVLAALDSGNRVQFWQLPQGTPQASVKFDHPVRRIFVSPDGSRLVALFKGNTAALVDVPGGKQIAGISHAKPINHCAFAKDGAHFATSSWDDTAKIWSAADGKEVATLLHPSRVNGVAFHPGGGRVVTACSDLLVRIWNLPDTPPNITLPHEKTVSQVSFSRDGRLIISAGGDSTARLWSMPDGALKHTLVAENWLNNAVMSRDDRWIVTTDSLKTAIIWDAGTGRLLRKIPMDEFVSAVALHPGGTTMVTAHRDNSARIWDLSTGRLLHRLRHSLLDNDSNLNQVAYSTSGDFVVTAGNDHHAFLWDVAKGVAIRRLTHGKAVYHAGFSPDDSQILTCGADKTAILWDRATGRKVHVFTHKEEVTVARFSPAGTCIVSAAADGDVSLWDTSSGRLLVAMPHPGPVTKAVFSSDGLRLLTACNDKVARLWNLTTGSILATFPQPGMITSLAISPGDKAIAIAGGDSLVRLYDWRIPFQVGLSTSTFEPYQDIANAATASEITANGSMRILTSVELDAAKRRVESLAVRDVPEAKLWDASRPDSQGR